MEEAEEVLYMPLYELFLGLTKEQVVDYNRRVVRTNAEQYLKELEAGSGDSCENNTLGHDSCDNSSSGLRSSGS